MSRTGSRLRRAALTGAVLALALSGCETADTVSTGGVTAPPEARAYKTPPLSLPPDYAARPPRKGTAESAETAAQARKRGGGGAARPEPQTSASLDGVSSGTAMLLQRTGAPEALPDIRDKIARETTILAHENQQFVDRLIFGPHEIASDAPEIVLQRNTFELPF